MSKFVQIYVLHVKIVLFYVLKVKISQILRFTGQNLSKFTFFRSKFVQIYVLHVKIV